MLSIHYRKATTLDLGSVEALLKAVSLPVEGVADNIASFVLADNRSEVLGVAGLELYGDSALLRSVAVKPGMRGQGIGRSLVIKVIETAKAIGVHRLFLLTETAQMFFAKLDFALVRRENVDIRVRNSSEFTRPCCEGAEAMVRDL